MSFFDNLQENIDDLKYSFSDFTRKVAEDSSQIKKIAKLKYEIAMEQKNLNELYRALGEHTFQVSKGMTCGNFSVEGHIAKIERSIARLESLKMALVNVGSLRSSADLDTQPAKDEIVYFDQKDLK